MNDSDTNAGTRQSVVALVKEDGVLKGVELRRHNGATEILWAKSTDGADVSWQSFAAECGLAVGPSTEQAAANDKKVVVGFGSAGRNPASSSGRADGTGMASRPCAERTSGHHHGRSEKRAAEPIRAGGSALGSGEDHPGL